MSGRRRLAMLQYTLLRTALSPLLVMGDQDGLRRLEFLPRAFQAATRARAIAIRLGRHEELPRENPASFTDLQRRLAAYLVGEGDLDDLALAPDGTPFQLAVWQRVRRIGLGELKTYHQIARELGEPRATRAVGSALAANPLPLLIPCHRVIGSDGRLTGYAGGLGLKAQLLRLEGHHVDGDRLIPPQLF